MKLLIKFVLFVFFWPAVLLAKAEIYKYSDPATGMILYSNTPVTPHRSTPAEASAESPAPRQPTKPQPSPSTAQHFPGISRETQRERDAERRRILQDELQEEQSALEQALSKSAKEEVIRRHKSNIAALQREMQNTR